MDNEIYTDLVRVLANVEGLLLPVSLKIEETKAHYAYTKIERQYELSEDSVRFAYSRFRHGKPTAGDLRTLSFADPLRLLCSIRLDRSLSKRYSKLHSKVEQMLSDGDCLFVTFTFSDESLARSSWKTRRDAVCRYLSRFSARYIANIDYGKENGREHYHAVVLPDKDLDLKFWQSRYGIIQIEHIRVKDYTSKRVSKYVNKLTAHALKTGKQARVIYSRGQALSC